MTPKHKGYFKLVLCDGKIVAGTLEFTKESIVESISLDTGEVENIIQSTSVYNLEISLDANGFYNICTFDGRNRNNKKVSPEDLQNILDKTFKSYHQYKTEYKKTSVEEYKEYGVIPEIESAEYVKFHKRNLDDILERSAKIFKDSKIKEEAKNAMGWLYRDSDNQSEVAQIIDLLPKTGRKI